MRQGPARSERALELGWTSAELRARVRDGAIAAAELGLVGRQVLHYLRLVNPTLPGPMEALCWQREVRRRVGRWRSTVAGWQHEYAACLPFGPPPPINEATPPAPELVGSVV